MSSPESNVGNPKLRRVWTKALRATMRGVRTVDMKAVHGLVSFTSLLLSPAHQLSKEKAQEPSNSHFLKSDFCPNL